MDYISYENVSGATLVASPYTMLLGTEIVSTTGVIPELEAKIGLGINKYVNGILQTYYVEANPVNGTLGSKGVEVSVGGGGAALSAISITNTGTPDRPFPTSCYSGAINLLGITHTGKFANSIYIRGKALATSALTSVSFDDVVWVDVDCILDANNNLVTASFPLLVGVWDDLRFTSNSSLVNINLPELLYTMNFALSSNCNAVVNLSLPKIKSIGFNLYISYCSSLTSISMPLIERMHTMNIDNVPSLTSINFGSSLKEISENITIGAVPSNVANYILATVVTLDGTNGTVLYNTGTIDINGTPTGQGITDKATLISRGCTVNTL